MPTVSIKNSLKFFILLKAVTPSQNLLNIDFSFLSRAIFFIIKYASNAIAATDANVIAMFVIDENRCVLLASPPASMKKV